MKNWTLIGYQYNKKCNLACLKYWALGFFTKQVLFYLKKPTLSGF